MSLQLPTDLDELTARYHAWHEDWAAPVKKWVAINHEEQPTFARLLAPVPELLRLMINLIKDPYLAHETRVGLYEIVLYVFEGKDAIPEAEVGAVGLVDDGVKMAHQLQQLIGKYTLQLRNNWSGEGDILELIEFITENGKDYLKV